VPASPTTTTAVPDTLRPLILLAEDEAALRRLLARLLALNGFDVMEAGDGAEALQLIAARKRFPDLLITDVVMPRMGGLELAVELRLTCPLLPVLFISGYADSVFLGSEELRNGTFFLSKPFPPDTLINQVRQMFAAANNSRGAAS